MTSPFLVNAASCLRSGGVEDARLHPLQLVRSCWGVGIRSIGTSSCGGGRIKGAGVRYGQLVTGAHGCYRGINTQSPLEAELEYQRSLEEREAAQQEMRETAAAIADAKQAASPPSLLPRLPSSATPPIQPTSSAVPTPPALPASSAAVSESGYSMPPASASQPKPSKPRPPVFGAPMGTGVGGSRVTPAVALAEKPKPKTTIVKAPTMGIAMHSDGRSGPAGNRNLMPELPEKVEKDMSQGHLRQVLAEGSFEKYGVGGLDTEFLTIFRRVFASRMVSPEVVKRLGMRHVKGMLLYGPPGTGKTLVARQLGKLLNAHPPKVVNGPEILQRFVGQSEENMRDLFAPAEKEFKGKGDKSQLHVIIFDEIDAIMKVRGTGGATASVVHDNVVNQLLTKLDGMQSLDNVLVVGITNRRDLLDPAVLRPGRLELQVEVGLPDRAGRVQIFNIHTAKMRTEGLLGTCVNIEQLAASTSNYSGAEIKGLVGAAQSHALARYLQDMNEAGVTLEDELATGKAPHSPAFTASTPPAPCQSASGFGAEPTASSSVALHGQSATSRAGAKAGATEGDANGSASSICVTMRDFVRAAGEVRPAMGADEEALAALRPLGMLCSCPTGSAEVSAHKRARDAIAPLLRAVAGTPTSDWSIDASSAPNSQSDPVGGGVAASRTASVGPEHLTILVHGPPGVGKSAAVAAAASAGHGNGGSLLVGGHQLSDAQPIGDGDGVGMFPHVKVFRADVVAARGGDVEHALRTAFDDAAKVQGLWFMIYGLRFVQGSGLTF